MCCGEEDINPTNGLMALTCLILNIFLPGVGTMVNACLGTRMMPGLCYGLLQMLLAPLLIGWIWSIFYGVKILQMAGKERYIGVSESRQVVDGTGVVLVV